MNPDRQNHRGEKGTDWNENSGLFLFFFLALRAMKKLSWIMPLAA
jgi:hypothetical protein